MKNRLCLLLVAALLGVTFIGIITVALAEKGATPPIPDPQAPADIPQPPEIENAEAIEPGLETSNVTEEYSEDDNEEGVLTMDVEAAEEDIEGVSIEKEGDDLISITLDEELVISENIVALQAVDEGSLFVRAMDSIKLMFR